jgi:hypothetical protein
MFTTAASVTQDFLEKSGLMKKEKLFVTMRITMTVLMALGITMALVIRDIVDATFFFVSMTMSLGFLTLVIWIYPKINRYSVNLAIFFCLIGVIVPAIIFGISTTLVVYAIGFCIFGMIFGFIINWIKPLPE